MINGKKIIVCLPAYNAAKTLKRTFAEIPFDIVDDIVLVDDASTDGTLKIASELGIKNILKHSNNRGYGANQKTCYARALDLGADVVIMLHPDYQYDPKLIPAFAHLVANNIFPVVLGSRILGKDAVKNGMPLYKYIFNRILTLIQNLLLNQKLSEYHTGYRAYSKQVLEHINFNGNSDDFVFDNEVLAQVCYKGYVIGEVSCPAKYFPEASSINFRKSIIYGCGVLVTSVKYRLSKWKMMRCKLFDDR
jgi:glycosyltransferase involved in cell wall biosynthesis